MPRTVNPFKLGLFVLLCGTLGLIAVIWLGASHYFEKTKTYVSYFDESVKGLQKDAVVNYRGVAVGRVAAIDLAPDGRLIEVMMHLKPNFQVNKSIAIQLREQGLTGMRYLEIDTAPDNLDKLTPPIEFSLKYPVVPSYPSEYQQLKNALQALYERFSSLDLETLTSNWTKTAELVNGVLTKIDGVLESKDWQETADATRKTAKASAAFMEHLASASSQKGMQKGFKDLSATLEASRQASESLARQLKELPPDSLSNVTKHWNETIKAGGALFTDVDRQLAESTVLFQENLLQFKILLTQLNGLVQTLKDQPNRILFPAGEPDPFKRK